MNTANTNDCSYTTELLPWLFNGSLEPTERARVLAHLSTCATCRAEAAGAATAWSDLVTHIPTSSLVHHALGLPSNGLDSQQIEAHLAVCPTCREEWDLIRAEEADEPPREHRLLRFRRSAVRILYTRGLAAAAAALLLSIGALLFWGRPSVESRVASRQIRSSEATIATATRQEERDPAALLQDGFEDGTFSAWSRVHH